MDDWKQIELNDACSRLSSGKSISAKYVTSEGIYPIYGGNGIRGYTDIYNFDGYFAQFLSTKIIKPIIFANPF